LSNCQDGCQTNSRRYDDLLSTDRVDLSNTYRVIVGLLVRLGTVRSATHSVSWASCYTIPACDRQTDGRTYDRSYEQTDGHATTANTANTALA